MKHKQPKIRKIARLTDMRMRVCRTCDNLTLHYKLARLGWFCNRAIRKQMADGKIDW